MFIEVNSDRLFDANKIWFVRLETRDVTHGLIIKSLIDATNIRHDWGLLYLSDAGQSIS